MMGPLRVKADQTMARAGDHPVEGVQTEPKAPWQRPGALARALALPLTPAGPGAFSDVWRVAVVAVQLGLVLLIFRVFHVEEDTGFMRLAPLIFFGFLAHAALPLRYRLPFFLLLSLGAFWLLYGPPVLLLLGLGLGLIGLCHLPLRLGARVALLLAAGAALAVVRAGVGPLAQLPWLSVVMPVLGSIFMFRLIIYLYDLQHEKTPASVWERLSYFFLLPNACFLFFPVVDYQTFRRTYYNAAAADVYQKGVFWMFRGLTHLLLYRLLYYYVVPGPTAVDGAGTALLFVFGTYLLYLRVTGLFHLITGVLALFGFNLPETNHHFLLASGFNDFWRRANIYWKDFMMKVFYYPAFMRLRKGGMLRGIVLATALVFVATWFLHSYQWFWLLGAFPLTLTDALFWTVFGALVVVNSAWQFRAGKKASLSKPTFSLRGAVVHALKVVAMFTFIAVLWSFWYSPSPADWLAIMGEAAGAGPGVFALLALGAAALVLVGVGVQYANSRGFRFTLAPEPLGFPRAALVTGLGALLVLGLGAPPVQRLLGERAGPFVASLQEDRLSEYDAQQADRGYYDALLTTNSISAQTGGVQNQQPADWVPLEQSEAVRHTGDLLVYELIPGATTEFKRVPLVVNQWGMRDQEYPLEKPEGTFRIALLGASIEMGAGVANEETFEALAEARLNAEQAGRGAYDRYEILNFAVGGYSVLQQLVLVERALTFDPDLLIYTGHTVEDSRTLQLLTDVIRAGTPLPPHLEAIRREAGVDASTPPVEITRRLEPYAPRILQESYTHIVGRTREAGVRPVWVFVPRTTENRRVAADGLLQAEALMQIARASGFPVLSIGDAYDGVEDHLTIALATWDDHPNIRGHQLLAARLYEVLLANAGALGLDGAAAPPAAATAAP
jgi:hypothetical protein